ncbi:hypothetical protein CVQ47_003043 [Salmonella enterica subsp. enterica serovar Javiana]|uniref:Uncharacterized protein n=1 Tax=Salmonella enterica TaxID=28901 RepID=A0A5Z4AGW5_SALER|nr:hypothetical protein [Salmonella enterica]ECB9331788.1 hypothetical protein [Salmonella enterica subsp. enterica serovar Javiana]EAM4147249.1 hypothetical protein [Salmonella enterica]EAM4170234.1 hypothetical protein [Salmonella enterica]EAM7512186.1 hypothetical protein [Salmonella enterica]
MRFIWEHYWLNPDPVVGLFTAFGAIVTALAVTYSVKAVKEAQNNTRVAREALNKATLNAKRDEFVRHFTMLLEQHNVQLAIVKRFLDDEYNAEIAKKDEEKKGLLPTLSRPVSHIDAFNLLRGHSVISPYMRILYHLLKYVAEDFYTENATLKQKKKYTSVVRSLIRNDVLFLVAVNASYIRENGKETQYAAYQQYLHDFDFFEHAIFFCPKNTNGDKDENVISEWNENFVKIYCEHFKNVISQGDPDSTFDITFSFPPAMVVSFIFNSPKHNAIVGLMNDLPDYIKKAFEDAKTAFVQERAFFLNMESFFNEYMGRSVFEIPDNGQTVVMCPEDYANNYQDKPVVDVDFIQSALNNLKKTGRISDSHQFFYDHDKKGSQLTRLKLTDRCREFASLKNLWDKANDGTYDPIQEKNIKRWQDLVGEIQLQQR